MFKYTLFSVRASKEFIRTCNYTNNSVSISHLFEVKNVGDLVRVQVKYEIKMSKRAILNVYLPRGG